MAPRSAELPAAPEHSIARYGGLPEGDAAVVDGHQAGGEHLEAIGLEQPLRLSGEQPQWISMAYANFDNGVIRSNRTVTFLTRNEPDGFSLRIVPRGGPPPQGPQMAQAAPPPNYPPPGPYTQQQQIYPAPAPYVPPQAAYAGFHT